MPLALRVAPLSRSGSPTGRSPPGGWCHRLGALADLLLDQFEVCGLDQPGGDAVVGEGLELGVGVGGVAVALHHRQVLVVAIGALQRAGLEGFQEHGAAGGEAGAFALAQLGRIVLLEVGHTHQGVGIGAVAGTGGGLRRPYSGLRRRGASQPPERPALQQRFGFMDHQTLQRYLQPGPVVIQLRIGMGDVIASRNGAAHRNNPRRPGARAG